MFFGVQERKKKKNEISFLHFIVFFKRRNQERKKTNKYQSGIKVLGTKKQTDKERKKINFKTLKKTKPTQPYKIVRQKVNKHPSKKPINKMH